MDHSRVPVVEKWGGIAAKKSDPASHQQVSARVRVHRRGL